METFNKQAIDKLIVALDYTTVEEAEKLVNQLGDLVSTYKVGLEIFLNTQGKIIDYLHSQGKKVFLDLKFHDITNTTLAACKYAASRDVFMFNIHCSVGSSTIKAIADMLKQQNSKSLFIGVTVLTNLSEADIKQMFATPYDVEQLVLNMAKFSQESGLHGIVCSAQEAATIKNAVGQEFVTVCPGVRLADNPADDQVRIMTPEKAILNGADYLVVGRPITRTQDPVANTKRILESIELGLTQAK